MSGGVDSSVAALLSQKRGDECIGVTMKLFSNDDVGEERDRPCCSLTDASDAARVAWSLGMPHYVFDFSERFRGDVIERFVSSYEEGLTPNPCIDCNTYLKFGALMGRMREASFDVLVTGHYAISCFDEDLGRYVLKKAVDDKKDQTYFLYTATQEELAHMYFPLGELTKPQARELAAEAGFVTAKKKESQDICFVSKAGYANFIENYTGRASSSGNFVSAEGEVLGKHKGIVHYTIGQRKRLGIALGRPVFVSDIRPKTNEMVLSDEAEIFSSSCVINEVNLIAFEKVTEPVRAEVKIRYGAEPAPALVSPISADGTLRIDFDEPQRAITRGQAAVMYIGDIVLGGGRII
ncbi:MAG: tRNA 2-thiouridine(34) synthase MnmA [Clostridiales Family XIII bacterium]|nr:tRNA 2-thiouridine(34) synthase MnmA [Clostridiales Family XIII bacterium]